MKISKIYLKVKDPRKARGVRYNVEAAVHMIMAGLIAGRNTLLSTWSYCQELTLEQRQQLGLPRGRNMSYSNLTLLVRHIDPEELKEAIKLCMESQTHNVRGITAQNSKLHEQSTSNALSDMDAKAKPGLDLWHVDGKTIRGSYNKRKDKEACQVLSAYNSKTRLVEDQEVIENHDEHKAMLGLVQRHDSLEGKLMSGDAIFLSPVICEEITRRDGHFLFTLKDNKKSLKRATLLAFEEATQAESQGTATIRRYCDDVSLAHGRVEQRSIEVIDMPWEYQNGYSAIKQLCRVTRVRHDKSNGHGATEVALLVTSLDKDQASARALLRANRTHWSVENNLHWIKDVIFEEDKSRVREGNSPVVLSMLRGFAHTILSSFSKKITETRRWFSMMRSRVIKLFSSPPRRLLT